MEKEMTHTEFADGLRQIADFLESHLEIDLPEPTMACYRLYNKEKLAVTAQALSRGGRCEKVFTDTLVELQRSFGPILLNYIGTRSNCCEQVKVGTRVIPEQYVPPKPAIEGHTVPEHEEAVYEWLCAPILGKPGVEVPENQPTLTAGGTPILEAEYVDSF